MEFYELVLFMTFFGQRCINVFNFTMTGTPAVVSGAYGLLYAFGVIPDSGLFPAGSIFAQLRNIQSSAVQYNQARVKNPYDPTDFTAVPFAAGVSGAASGEALSPTLAYSFSSSQVRSDIRAGQKRFVGVPEAQVNSGGTIVGALLPTLQELADTMAEPITYDDEGNTLTYNLVVAQKYNDLEADPPIKNAYWPTKSQQLAHLASGGAWTPRPYVSTQTSRQYGHGR